MSKIDDEQVLREAQQHVADVRRSTRFTEAVNHYLGALGYGYARQVSAPPAAGRGNRDGGSTSR